MFINLFLVLSIIGIASIISAEPYKIYKSARIKSYFHNCPKMGRLYSSKFVLGKQSNQKSILKKSTAEIIAIPPKLKKVFNSSISDRNNYIVPAISKCMKITYKTYVLYIIADSLIAKHERSRNGRKTEPFIFIAAKMRTKYQNVRRFRTLFTGGNSRIGNYKYVIFISKSLKLDDTIYSFRFIGVSDVDSDGCHEILMVKSHYAGNRLIVIKNYFGTAYKLEMHGRTWD